MVIYITTNLINNKKYIGKDRYNNSFYYGSGTFLKKAIKKHGIKNFKKEILQYCNSVDEMNEAEKYWINYFNAVKSNLFYNIAEGGNCFVTKNHPIKSIREKQQKSINSYNLNGEYLKTYKSIAEASRDLKIDNSGIIKCVKGGIARYKQYIFKYNTGFIEQKIQPYKLSLVGKKRDSEIVLKIANSNRGKKRTLEQCIKNGLVNKGRVQSIEERLKRSDSHKLRNKLYPRTKEHIYNNAIAQMIKVDKYDLNGNFIETYPSLKHAGLSIGKHSSYVCAVLKGKQKHSNGFIFKYNSENKR